MLLQYDVAYINHREVIILEKKLAQCMEPALCILQRNNQQIYQNVLEKIDKTVSIYIFIILTSSCTFLNLS